MFRSLKNSWSRKQLKNDEFAFLFDNYEGEEVVVFDCETTGLNTKKDDIISIGAVKIRDNKILTNDALHLFVEQKEQISHESITIHQIRHCDLENAVPLEEAMHTFLHFIGNRTLVGYFLEFDIAMINKSIKPMLGISLPNRQEEVSASYYDKRIESIPQGHVDLRFESILTALALPKFEAHDALNDAVMTAMMYVKLKHIKKIR